MMKKYLIFAFMASLIVISASFWASKDPDGLDSVAEKLGFSRMAVERTSPLADYSVPFLGGGAFSRIIAGLVGAAVCFLFFVAVEKLGRTFFLRKKNRISR
jgi:cobalt/nickel transport protein